MENIVLITGASGKLGGFVAEEILKTGKFAVRLLLRASQKNKEVAARFAQLYGQNVEIVYGDVMKKQDCAEALSGARYALHFAAVVPPKSCHYPEEAERVNYFGTKNLVDAIKEASLSDTVRFVEVGSMAEYGNRNYHHPWARVGDPLMPSAFDIYGVSKIRAERYVASSGLGRWCALRIGCVLYDDIIFDNIRDGLMLYTPANAPIETITLSDLGRLFLRLIERDAEGVLDKSFWRRIYNVGGGSGARLTGYGLYDKGFALMGGKVESLLKPNWLPTRNFFTAWFADSDVLDGYLDYRRDSADDFFNGLKEKYRLLKLAKPFGFALKKLVFERLNKSANAPVYWLENGMTDRVNAFFGGYDNARRLPRKWNDYPVLEKGRVYGDLGEIEKIDYRALLSEEGKEKLYLSHGFDDKKDDEALTFNDLREAAAFRGGKCLDRDYRPEKLHTPIVWECHNGHTFKATAYGVLRGGYWCPDCCTPAPWNFDEISKSVPFYAQVWYDTHGKHEETYLTAECYKDIPREDNRTDDPGLGKIKKYKKG